MFAVPLEDRDLMVLTYKTAALIFMITAGFYAFRCHGGYAISSTSAVDGAGTM